MNPPIFIPKGLPRRTPIPEDARQTFVSSVLLGDRGSSVVMHANRISGRIPRNHERPAAYSFMPF